MTFKDYCTEYFSDCDYIECLQEQIRSNTEKLEQLEKDARSEELYPSFGIAKYGGMESSGNSNLSVVEKAATIHHQNCKEIKQEIYKTNYLISTHIKERANLIIKITPFQIALKRLNEIDRQIITLKYGGVRCGKKISYEEIASRCDITDKTVYEHINRLAQEFPRFVESIANRPQEK